MPDVSDAKAKRSKGAKAERIRALQWIDEELKRRKPKLFGRSKRPRPLGLQYVDDELKLRRLKARHRQVVALRVLALVVALFALFAHFERQTALPAPLRLSAPDPAPTAAAHSAVHFAAGDVSGLYGFTVRTLAPAAGDSEAEAELMAHADATAVVHVASGSVHVLLDGATAQVLGGAAAAPPLLLPKPNGRVLLSVSAQQTLAIPPGNAYALLHGGGSAPATVHVSLVAAA